MRSFLGSLITLPFLRVVGPEEELEDEGPVILPFQGVVELHDAGLIRDATLCQQVLRRDVILAFPGVKHE